MLCGSENKYFSDFIHLEFCCEMAFRHRFAFKRRPIKNIHKSSLELVSESEAAVLYRWPRSSITGVKCSGAPWSGRHQWKRQQMFSLQIWCVRGEIWTSRTSDRTLACCDCSRLLFFGFTLLSLLTFWKVLPRPWSANVASRAALTYTCHAPLCKPIHQTPNTNLPSLCFLCSCVGFKSEGKVK